VSEQYPEEYKRLLQAKNEYQKTVLSELPEEDLRPFPVGHPEFLYTQLPARDGVAHGNIKRSNRWPNCSFYTNWVSTNDSITWNVEVLDDGDFEAVIYYTCNLDNVGTSLRLSFGGQSVTGTVDQAHDPPLTGMENDLVERQNSYVKDFRPFKLGTIRLTKGKGIMSLSAPQIPGNQAIDFRLLMLTRQE
jgi:hypothetical protein